MSKETQIDRHYMIATWLDTYEEQLIDAPDDELFSDDELDRLRQSQIEALVEQYEATLAEQDNAEIFGNEPWEKVRDAEIEQRVEAERMRLEGLTDKQLLAAFLDVAKVAPSNE